MMYRSGSCSSSVSGEQEGSNDCEEGITTRQHPVVAIWAIRSQNWHVANDFTNLLAKEREMKVQSTRFFCSHALAMRLSSRRRSPIGVSCFPLNQATALFLLSHAPSTLLALDKAAKNLTSARDARRSCQRETRTAC